MLARTWRNGTLLPCWECRMVWQLWKTVRLLLKKLQNYRMIQQFYSWAHNPKIF